MVNVDVRTRVELKNETQRTTARKGTAGRIALIGAFPSGKQRIYAAESFGQVVNHYGVKLNSTAEKWYGGVRAAKRMFMEGIRGYAGANSVTCVNISQLTPTDFKDLDLDTLLYKENYDESEIKYDNSTDTKVLINAGGVNNESQYVPENETLKRDTALTFEKLKIALQQIADEDMDMLFIANDLWEIFDYPYSKSWEDYPVAKSGDPEYTKGDGSLKDDYMAHTLLVKKGTRAPSLILNSDNTYRLKCPFQVGDDGKFIKEGGNNVRITPETGLNDDETFISAVFQKYLTDKEGNKITDSNGNYITWWKDGPEIFNDMDTIGRILLDTRDESKLNEREKVIWEVLPQNVQGNTLNGKFNEPYEYSEQRYPPALKQDNEMSATSASDANLTVWDEYVAHTILIKKVDNKRIPSLVLNSDGSFGFKCPFQVGDDGQFIKETYTDSNGEQKQRNKYIDVNTGLESGETPVEAVFIKSALANLSNGVNSSGESTLNWNKPSVYTTSGIVDALVLAETINGESQNMVEYKATSQTWEDFPVAHSSDFEVRDVDGGYKVGLVPHTIIARRTKYGTHIPSLIMNDDGTYGLKYPFKRDAEGNTIRNGSTTVLLDKEADGMGCKLNADEVAFTAVFNGTNDELVYPSKLEGPISASTPSKPQDAPYIDSQDPHPLVTWYKTVFQTKSDALVFNKTTEVEEDLTQAKVTWEAMALDKYNNTIYGITDTGKPIRNIGEVYDYILDFVDNEFTNHRPVNYIGAIKTRATPEGNENIISSLGVGSKVIRVNGTRWDYESEDPKIAIKHTPTEDNLYADIKEWGAVDIANLFTRTTNELSTCGLFYQSGIIAGEEVDAMELAAHIAGWICSINLTQDLTYQTIPALTAVNEEPFLGEYDAGGILNQAGIQVIRPKSRLDKSFYVNNSIQPTGWHTNHIRTVTYLLKRLQFESGLGINNYITNVEAYRAMLESVAKDVMDEIDLIREVEIGEVEIISNYHIFVPITIILSGVVTLINVGVGMALDETGTVGTYIKSTSGYSVHV